MSTTYILMDISGRGGGRLNLPRFPVHGSEDRRVNRQLFATSDSYGYGQYQAGLYSNPISYVKVANHGWSEEEVAIIDGTINLTHVHSSNSDRRMPIMDGMNYEEGVAIMDGIHVQLSNSEGVPTIMEGMNYEEGVAIMDGIHVHSSNSEGVPIVEGMNYEEGVAVMDGILVHSSNSEGVPTIMEGMNYEEGVAVMDGIHVHSSNSEDRVSIMEGMSYEENLELEESMGRVGSRLSEEKIMEHLKTRNSNAANTSISRRPDICVICQAEYEESETIGALNCRHEYHAECIKKWLLQKNNCPICKATAVS